MYRLFVCVFALCLFFPSSLARLPKLHRDHVWSDSGPQAYCANPVPKVAVNFSEILDGRAPHSFDMYSGYVNVTSQDWLFYWFLENKNQDTNAPLLIWTNGGPGCSSMEGATTEIGALVLEMIKESCQGPQCDYTEQLSLNPYAWNNHANVLFLDQPRYVGYSFGYGPEVKSSVDAAADFISFYLGWLELFPEFYGRALYIAGESYGGHYIPAWANAILNYNENAGILNQINFQGVAIGNGCVNNSVQSETLYVEFLKTSNLLPNDENPRTAEEADLLVVKNIGYEPNYYDYRVICVTCPACYCYNYTAWSHWFLRQDVLDALHVCGDAGQAAFAGNAGGCIPLAGFDTNDKFDYSGALGRTLDAKIPVVFYYGKADTACNYVGGYQMANTISWSGQKAFSTLELSPLEISGAEAGQIKEYGGLTWIQIESAGHMVPLNQPAGASYAITHLLGISQ